MKLNLQIVAAALTATIVAPVNAEKASLPAPSPQFQSSSQLQKQRIAPKAIRISTTRSDVSNSDIFYTGKISEIDSGGYLFLFRKYNSTIARWTTHDPLGYPDGANSQRYAPSPTFDVDPNGAFSLGGIVSPTASAYSGDLTIAGFGATKVTSSASSRFGSIVSQFSPTYSISFAGSELAGSIDIRNYYAESGPRMVMDMLYSGDIASGSDLVWMQAAYKSTPNHSWDYLPDNRGAAHPWAYRSNQLLDKPGLPAINGSNFSALSYLAIKTGSSIQIYDNAVSWGFSVYE